MEKELFNRITNEAKEIFEELVDLAGIGQGEILVIGCSSSEIVGTRIGKGSSSDAARAVYDAVYPIARERGIYLAAQCCEHLNRAIVVERECAEKYGLEMVCVKPQAHAGGAFATECYDRFDAPVVVEQISAHAGIDIGGTLIGMHLRRVAVPLRLSRSKLGEANILCAKTRPKFIGGIRAQYPETVQEINR